MTAAEARTRFQRLQMERIDALELGVDETSAYIRYLGEAIDDAKTDYVASAVTEIAAMRDDIAASASQDLTVFSD
jgi:hypothetical protein